MAGGHGESYTYKSLTLHQPKRWHTVTGKCLCAVMWAGGILGKAMMTMDMDTRHRIEERNGKA